MATGTGKTRTASSLTDVLSRGGHVTNVLFLADRTALVKQAKDDFKKYLPDQSLCNLCSSKDDKAARIVFSTYPTMLNAIDNAKTKDGVPLFSLRILTLSSWTRATAAFSRNTGPFLIILMPFWWV